MKKKYSYEYLTVREPKIDVPYNDPIICKDNQSLLNHYLSTFLPDNTIILSRNLMSTYIISKDKFSIVIEVGKYKSSKVEISHYYQLREDIGVPIYLVRFSIGGGCPCFFTRCSINYCYLEETIKRCTILYNLYLKLNKVPEHDIEIMTICLKK